MIGNILKVMFALIIGYLVGLITGGGLGVLLGLAPSLFFREIASSNLSVLMSLLLSIVLGCMLGYLEILIFNKMFDFDDKPLFGSVAGIIFGLFFGVSIYGYGVLYVPDSETFNQTFYTVALVYSGALGSRIGSAIFSLYGAVGIIRDIVRSQTGVIPLNWK